MSVTSRVERCAQKKKEHDATPAEIKSRRQKEVTLMSKNKLTTMLDVRKSKIGTSSVSLCREPYLDHYDLTLWWALKSPFVTCDSSAASTETRCPANLDLIKYIHIFQHKEYRFTSVSISYQHLTLNSFKPQEQFVLKTLPVACYKSFTCRNWFGDKL